MVEKKKPQAANNTVIMWGESFFRIMGLPFLSHSLRSDWRLMPIYYSIIWSFIFWTGSSLADINLGLIRYVLHEETVQETMDNFKFLVKDSKPNVVSDNVFHIQWSLVSFEHKRLHFFTRFYSGKHRAA